MKKTTSPETVEQTPDSTPNSKEALYDRFVEKSHKLFELGQEKGHEAWEKAMEQAHQQMTAAGEFTAEQGKVFKRYLQRDLEHTISHMNELGKEAKVGLHPARLGAGALSTLAKLLHATGGALTSLSAKAEKALEYQSGEITMAGTITCLTCGKEIQLSKTSVVPTCPSCQGTKFRKSY